ncbi:MAG: hypothetical protein HYX56_05050 [Chloroflexi bacterium]|nr:hypothetical protein [Chloroflexota bacterium]
MSLQLLFVILVLALIVAAGVLLVVVIFRRERQLANLALALFLIALAVGVWWTSIRTPLPVR